MKLKVSFKLKSNTTSWSDQVCSEKMSDGAEINICIDRTECKVEISHDSSEKAHEYLYLVWELLNWYDGYFYKPIRYLVDGKRQKKDALLTLNMYTTDQKWISSALLIGRDKRLFTEEIILKYKELRNKERKDKSMNKSMINSYFYLISEAYGKVIIEHRLVLLMHICDGFAREFFKKTRRNNIGNINTIVGQLNSEKYKHGAGLLGVAQNKALDALGNTRNELSHFEYVANKPSLGSYISNPSYKTDTMVYLYAFYVLKVALRVSLLNTIGFKVDDDIKEYLLDEQLDWIRLIKHLDEDCVLPLNRMEQLMQKLSTNESNDNQIKDI